MRYNLIIPATLKPYPTSDEMLVARTLADFFASDIEFVSRGISRTPDIHIVKLCQYWEIKNIRGNSSRTIANMLRSAQHQADNIAIFLGRTKMSTKQAVGRVRQYLSEGNTSLKRIVVVTKSGKIIVIK